MILQQAIDHYGVEHQLNKVQEELGELITAISKWRNDKGTVIDLIDEMADLEIMYKQLAIILKDYYPHNDIKIMVKDQIKLKLERLKQRIEDDQNRHGV